MKKKFRKFAMIPVVGMAILLSFSSCKKDEMEDEMNIVEVASSNSNFSTLVAALQKAGVVEALETYTPITVFAPTNAAFAELFNDLGVSGLDELSPETLAPILFYHVIGNKITSRDLTSGYAVTLSAGPDLKGLSILVNADEVKLNGMVNITDTDIMASNGVIHVIDKVLLPPSVVDIASQNSEFTHLVEAVVKAELLSTLSGSGPFTIFAPTDAAFESLFTTLGISGVADLTKEQLIPILQYHVVSGNVRSSNLSPGYVTTLNGDILVELGSSIKINNTSEVLAIDIQGKNGVIHVIDEVLLPESK